MASVEYKQPCLSSFRKVSTICFINYKAMPIFIDSVGKIQNGGFQKMTNSDLNVITHMEKYLNCKQ